MGGGADTRGLVKKPQSEGDLFAFFRQPEKTEEGNNRQGTLKASETNTPRKGGP